MDLSLQEALAEVRAARATDETQIVMGDETDSDAESMQDDEGGVEDEELEAFLNLRPAQPVHDAHDACDACDDPDDDDDDDDEVDAPDDDAADDDEPAADGPAYGPQEKPVDNRRKQRTNVHGKRMRKDVNASFKAAVKSEWMRLKGDQEPDKPTRRKLFAELKSWAAKKNASVIIHNLDQIEKWSDQVVRGQATRKKVIRAKDERRLTTLDTLLRGYIIGRRASNQIVTRLDILKQANLFLADPATRAQCKDKESVKSGYVQKFMQRCNFKVKAVKKRTALTALDIAERAQKLHVMIYRCLPLVVAVLNMDEVPGSLAGVMGKLKTVAETTDIDVRAYVSAAAFKRCCSVLAFGCVVRDGDGWRRIQLKPIILLKGTPGPGLLAEVYDERCIVAYTKKAVMTSECMLKVIIPAIREQLTAAGVQRALFVLDCCTSHLTPTVVNACWASGLVTAVIAAGCTSWLQWVDTHFAFAYRAYHSQAFQPYAGTKLTASQKRRLLARIVCDAHAHVGRNVVRDFELLGYTDPTKAKIRGVPEYVFQPPALVEADLQADEQSMQKRIQDALIERAKAPEPVADKAKVGRPSKANQPVTGYKDIRTFFPPRQIPPPSQQES